MSEAIPLNSKNKYWRIKIRGFFTKFGKIVGIAMIKKEFCKTSQEFQIKLNNKLVKGKICNLPIT